MGENQPDLPYAFNAEFTIGRERLTLQVRFSSRMVRASKIVPLLQIVTDKIVAIGVSEMESGGGRISCRKGCSACCSQLVPVSEPEARYLLPLSLLFDWAAEHTIDDEPQFSAAEYCENFLKRLAQPQGL